MSNKQEILSSSISSQEKKDELTESSSSCLTTTEPMLEERQDEKTEENGSPLISGSSKTDTSEEEVKEKKGKKNFLSKTVGGIAKGTKAVGHGLVKGTKVVGHGVVSGTKAVGHGVVSGTKAVGHGVVKGGKAVGHALSKDEKDKKKEKTKEESCSEGEIIVSEPLLEQETNGSDISLIDSQNLQSINPSDNKSTISNINGDTASYTSASMNTETKSVSQSCANTDTVSVTSLDKTEKETKKESKFRRFGKKRNSSNPDDPTLTSGSQKADESSSSLEKSEKSHNSKDLSKKTPEKEDKEKKGVFASAGKFVKGLGESTKEALTFSNEKSNEEKAKEEQENLIVLQLFKENVRCFDNSSVVTLPCESLTGYKRMNKSKVTKRDLVFAMCSNAVYRGTIKIDSWSTMEMPKDTYKEGVFGDSLITLNVKEDGYFIETCSESVDQKTDLKNFTIVDFESDFPFYKEFFYGNDQVKHYLSKEENVICSVQRFKEVSRCILRNNQGVTRCLIGKEESEKPQNYSKFFKDPKTVICLNNTIEIDEELLEMETKSLITHYKFGVIYVKPDQTEENAIFRNTPESCSPAFWKFLDLIGNKIELNGWSGYRGGLDVKTGTTGVNSYISHSNNFEIMFHVAPLLPLLQNDEQALERKRHVGNDVVVLIFKEQSSPSDRFDPRWLTSHFNSIFLVVTPEKTTEDNNKYHVTACTKPSINPFPPFINETGIYNHDDEFRDFVLRKLINGERMAMFSPTFKLNYKKTIREQLKDLNERYYKQDLLSQINFF
ncbi:hypothetical protein ENUP19_0298G0030 [Entamoeba nuttalli]|uniref:Rap/Ran GTPase-activating protein, putative n=2 Tax=Entamoeba nuttalli TaxID=412467 RepID=K2GB36_ENTNP|nr:Rap/Ran GTPase-activating protein, putative [Entamoeba nuttalli P19]EKE39696.1 Rap/Ran GTPase-activating protein, putative [Entamoeba nuttalli P19]|eukprot:XP_008857974.1 Rap/Ran GTPase-activating protein, putative [Entamoeba nuttalli P19]